MTSLRVNDRRENFQDGSFSVLHNLHLKVTSLLPYYCVHTNQPWYNIGGSYTSLCISGGGTVWNCLSGWYKSQMKFERHSSLSCPHRDISLGCAYIHPQIDTGLEPNQLLTFLETRRSKASHDTSWLTCSISYFPTTVDPSTILIWTWMCPLICTFFQ